MAKPFKLSRREGEQANNQSTGHQDNRDKFGDKKAEWSTGEPPFALGAKIEKGAGVVEKGVFNKKEAYNASLGVRTIGNVASLTAFYVTKEAAGTRKIKLVKKAEQKYSEDAMDTFYVGAFDAPLNLIQGKFLIVTVHCTFKAGFLKRKLQKVTVYLPIR